MSAIIQANESSRLIAECLRSKLNPMISQLLLGAVNHGRGTINTAFD